MKRLRQITKGMTAATVTAVLVAIIVLGISAETARAQTQTVLVSNAGETLQGSSSNHFLAQSFETGPNAVGYTITEIQIHLKTVGSNTTIVKIREDDGGKPGNLVATLVNPANLTSNALNMFTAPVNTTLAVSKTYWVTVSEGISNRVAFSQTDANDETGEEGWSIGNGRLWRLSETSAWASSPVNLVMTIKGSTNTITDPALCDNLANTIVVKNLTGEITQPGQSKFHRIRLDPYRSYMIEAIGHNGEDMLGVEEHPNLTLSNPDIPAIWNAKATSKWITYGDSNDGVESKNVIRRFLRTGYRTYKVEVASGTGTYQLKIRVNNICRINDDGNAQYQWAGGPKGYPAGSDLPAGTGGRQVLLTGTDWGNDNVTRPEMHHVLGDNWDSDRDEDWIGVDLEQGGIYTVRLRTKTSLPERLQATGLKVLGIRDANGNAISGTASAGAAGKKVFVTDWTAPSTGRFHIAVGSEGNDRTGTYWLSITKKVPN